MGRFGLTDKFHFRVCACVFFRCIYKLRWYSYGVWKNDNLLTHFILLLVVGGLGLRNRGSYLDEIFIGGT